MKSIVSRLVKNSLRLTRVHRENRCGRPGAECFRNEKSKIEIPVAIQLVGDKRETGQKQSDRSQFGHDR